MEPNADTANADGIKVTFLETVVSEHANSLQLKGKHIQKGQGEVNNGSKAKLTIWKTEL